MPDGRPGDHPISDIVVHGETVFGKPADDCIRRISNGAPPPILSLLGSLVIFWPRTRDDMSFWGPPVDPDGFLAMLESLERSWHELADSRR